MRKVLVTKSVAKDIMHDKEIMQQLKIGTIIVNDCCIEIHKSYFTVTGTLQENFINEEPIIAISSFNNEGKCVFDKSIELYVEIPESELKWQPKIGEMFIGRSKNGKYHLDIFSHKLEKDNITYYFGIGINYGYTEVLPYIPENIKLLGKRKRTR